MNTQIENTIVAWAMAALIMLIPYVYCADPGESVSAA